MIAGCCVESLVI